MRNAIVLTLWVVVFGAGGCGESLSRNRAKGPALAHNVYFALNDHSAAARARLIADCYTYLKVDQEHHDLYQKASEHRTFLDRNKDNWKTVRVFDTIIE